MGEPTPLAARPHYGRFPVPFVTHVRPDGRPDFRVHDNGRRAECAVHRLCQLCGLPMEGEMAFVGAKHSIERRTFGEPPMHPVCLDWAWEVCPWLAGGNWRREWADEAKTLLILPNPPGGERVMGILIAATYETIPDDEGSGSVKWIASEPLREVEWRDREEAIGGR